MPQCAVHDWCRFALQCRASVPSCLGMRRRDEQSLALFASIVHRIADDSATSLLRFRPQFRELIESRPTRVLAHIIRATEIEFARRLAIWLLGRCGHRWPSTVEAVAQYITDSPPRLRKEAVRCLVRLGAWSQFDPIDWRESHPRIRNYVCRPAARPFESRLARFTGNAPRTTVDPPDRPLVLAPGVSLDETPPKSASWIRLLLEHIHRLLQPIRRR